jgi:hypothetical protein
VTNKNYINEEFKSRLNSWSVFYHPLHDVSASRLLSENVKIKIYKVKIIRVILYGCETWSIALRKNMAEGVSEQGADKNICNTSCRK